MEAHIVLLPGDGIGPEVIHAAVQVLDAAAARAGVHFTYNNYLIGGCAIDAQGTALSSETMAACKSAAAVLLGAVGGPKWDDPNAAVRPEQGLLALRKGLGAFANIRPVKAYPALFSASPLKPEKLTGVDMVVMRELTGGLYFGAKLRENRGGHRVAVDTLEYADFEIERIARMAFEMARGRRKKVASVDKANVLESSRLWRSVVTDVSKDYPDVALEHVLVDTAAMRLVSNPASFDVVVTENMFGDILTDEAAVLPGSMGLLPSASLGNGGPGLYEPIHGSAPDIAGKGIANPCGAILSAALMLRYSFNMPAEANTIETAVEKAVNAGCLTRDLGGNLNTDEMTRAVLDRLD